ncbi:hypothetical protein BJF85_19220 [Saccharomonospora sp. CUA-673]|uniref:hypothetical protein n=1 Tax=Saccharomonospora sp. CUA-673 TaxID=1904969 RepID=UPI000969A9D5|nr:hypothetical protein [Saccharomonospora sp. CUA-673]OLT45379.1 hypothetical protein BJF85_19220 [Saccharomonospora sp. CUA-673]
MSLAELHASLNLVRSSLTDAAAEAARAKELLEEYRRALLDVQSGTAATSGDPWLPAQLPRAFDQIDEHKTQLGGVEQALDQYEARL